MHINYYFFYLLEAVIYKMRHCFNVAEKLREVGGIQREVESEGQREWKEEGDEFWQRKLGREQYVIEWWEEEGVWKILP